MKRSITIQLSPTHPDFHQAKQEATQARAYKNTITALTRNYYYYKRDQENADLSISQELGIDVTHQAPDKKGVLRDTMGYTPHTLAGSHVYAPIRAQVTPELHSHICQSISREVGTSWASHWALWKNSEPGNRPGIPGYTRSELAPVPYRATMLAKKCLARGIIRPTTWGSGVALPEDVDPAWVESARLVPVHGRKLELHVLYEDPREVPQVQDTQAYKALQAAGKELVAAGDRGKKNYLTVVFSDYREGLIYKGGPLLNIIDHYNDLIAGLQSKHDVERGGVAKRSGKNVRFIPKIRSTAVDQAWWKLKTRVKHFVALVSNSLRDSLVEAGATRFVLGWSDGFKQGMSIGRKNNRVFMGMAHGLLKDEIVRKLNMVGIEVVIQEESYTSKGSFLDDDFLPLFEEGEVYLGKFSGRRVKRGLYVSAQGLRVNADVNGAFNILRKNVPSVRYSVSACLEGGGSVVPRARNVVLPRV